MANSDDGWLVWGLIAAVGLGGYFYFKSADEPEPQPEPIYSSAVSAAGEAAVEGANESLPTPPTPTPGYQAEENGIYYYIPAATEDERKNGLPSGEALGFRYFGKNAEGAHLIVPVNRSGTPLTVASCSTPCKLIKYDDGRRVAYNPSTLIGSAFEDAMRGFLKSTKPKLRPIPQQEYQAVSTFDEDAPVEVTSVDNAEPEVAEPLGE